MLLPAGQPWIGTILQLGGQGRHRITHVELVDNDDIPRFKQLNVIADFQPSPYFTPSFLKDNVPSIGERAAK